MTRAELSAARLRPCLQTLTDRQREVAISAAQGNTYTQIGSALGITSATVKLHLAAAYTKLGISGHGAARELRLRRKEFGL